MKPIKDTFSWFTVLFFCIYNFFFGLLAFFFPYDMAAFEIDFDGVAASQ